MTDRSRLHHARGTAEDIPGLLEAVGPDPRDPGWDTLSDLLWSQGTVHPASFAALPRLTELARRWSPVERCMPLFLASRIVAARDIRGEAVDPFVTHTATLAELLALTEEALRDPPWPTTPRPTSTCCRRCSPSRESRAGASTSTTSTATSTKSPAPPASRRTTSSSGRTVTTPPTTTCTSSGPPTSGSRSGPRTRPPPTGCCPGSTRVPSPTATPGSRTSSAPCSAVPNAPTAAPTSASPTRSCPAAGRAHPARAPREQPDLVERERRTHGCAPDWVAPRRRNLVLCPPLASTVSPSSCWRARNPSMSGSRRRSSRPARACRTRFACAGRHRDW